MKQIIISIFITSLGFVLTTKAGDNFTKITGGFMFWVGVITLIILFILN